jgi:hypothetical protein
MYPSDLPPGYVEHWRMVISVYPPVDTQTMASALGGGYPGSMPFPPMSREVRLNTEKGRIEIWERTVEPAARSPARRVPGRIDMEPGKRYMQRTSGG